MPRKRSPTNKQGLRRVSAKDRRRRKRSVFKRDEHKCVFCGHTGSKENPLTADHKISVYNGGSNKIDNLQTACNDCNQSKGYKNDYVPSNGKVQDNQFYVCDEQSLQALRDYFNAKR